MSNMNLQGAVDLSRLARPQAPAQPAAQSSAHVIDVTTATFERDVLQQSMSVPVILDLWATWCGPCKQLSPILEKLAAEHAGAFVLAKVDVDQNPEISQAFQVQSIPAVVAVIGGRPAPLFTGALPEHQVRPLIDEVIAVAAKAGIGSAPAAGEQATEAPTDPRFDAVEAALEAGDWAAAIEGYTAILKATPGDAVAKVGLLNAELFARTDGMDIESTLALSDDDVETQMRIADAEFLVNRYDDAFARLVSLVKATSGKERAAVQERLLALFDVAGVHDPAVTRGRTALANALF